MYDRIALHRLFIPSVGEGYSKAKTRFHSFFILNTDDDPTPVHRFVVERLREGADPGVGRPERGTTTAGTRSRQ
jgi:hypothetical protein